MTDSLSLADVAALTFKKAYETGLLESAEQWFRYIYQSRYHLSILKQQTQLLGIAVAYPNKETLFVEWVVALQPGVMQEFLDRIKHKYPLTKILEFHRYGKLYRIPLEKIKTIQRIFNHG